MLEAACAAPLASDEGSQGPAGNPVASRPEQPVTDPAIAVNQRFQSLDEYLAFLETRSHVDGHWYREIRPGVYELQTGHLHLDNDEQKRIFTRAELLQKFGFTR